MNWAIAADTAQPTHQIHTSNPFKASGLHLIVKIAIRRLSAHIGPPWLIRDDLVSLETKGAELRGHPAPSTRSNSPVTSPVCGAPVRGGGRRPRAAGWPVLAARPRSIRCRLPSIWTKPPCSASNSISGRAARKRRRRPSSRCLWAKKKTSRTWDGSTTWTMPSIDQFARRVYHTIDAGPARACAAHLVAQPRSSLRLNGVQRQGIAMQGDRAKTGKCQAGE